ncbi:hypothetical protein F4556_003600 [Kitasatospora gansuensis]|uniref:PKD domain-containing protein n=1 Tax=Kitasatospora gansuensis TaxID=258050 RepID=A0A7W7SCQ9_9ACTN|nr:PKD domain-containing protein [Kitasatospora gansuensis]MBB4948065.1 hypothetical protein [Kitasatospora gansuensis]
MSTKRITGLAGSVALLLGLGLPSAAVAAEPVTTLYVSNSAPCSNQGVGSKELPFCQISAAALIVEPGQTVQVTPGTYNPARIVRSGAPGKPITFTTERTGLYGGSSATISGRDIGLQLSGVHDVAIENFTITSTDNALLIENSTDIRLDTLNLTSYGALDGAVRIAGTGSGVTLSRSLVSGPRQGTAVQVDGVRGSTFTGNQIFGWGLPLISVKDAPNTTLTGNSVSQQCGTTIRFAGASAGAAVHNNVIGTLPQQDTSCPVHDPVLEVAATATAGTTVGYNDLLPGPSGVPYRWADTDYPTPAALTTATGQGGHDALTDRNSVQLGDELTALQPGSTAIDSADPNAPGILATDRFGRSALDDPQVANTGAGGSSRDRGAFELVGTVPLGLTDGPAGPAPYPYTTKATVEIQSNWPETVNYLYDFGDGSAPVASTKPEAEHSYTRSGRFEVTATVTTGYAAPVTFTGPQRITVNEPGVPKVSFEAKHCAVSTPDSCFRPLAYVIDPSATTAAWPIAGYTIDYGDGSAPTDSLTEPHLYAVPGDYKITVTAKDNHGQTGSLTKTVTIGYQAARYPGGSHIRLIDTRTGDYTRLGSGSKLTVKVGQGGRGGWRDNAIVLNVTAVLPSGDGFLTVAPGGVPRPNSSNVNYTKGSIVPNMVTVPVGSDGTVAIWNTGSPLDVVVDMIGSYNPDYGSYYNPLEPSRVLDTRDGTGGVKVGKLTSVCGHTSSEPETALRMSDLPGVPADATDVVLNVTVTEPEQPGYLSVGNGYGGTSSLNFVPGQTVANQVIVSAESDRTIWFCTGAGKLHVVADIFGYYSPKSGSLFTPVPPVRLTDTREDPAGSLHADQWRAVATKLPAGATGAVLNVTAARSTTGSYLTLWGDGTTRPGTSNVNFPPGRIVANHVTTPLGTNGRFDIYNRSGDTDAVVDMFGYFSKP